jgi:hypothetical protein
MIAEPDLLLEPRPVHLQEPSMSDAAKYRSYADYCLDLAEKAQRSEDIPERQRSATDRFAAAVHERVEARSLPLPNTRAVSWRLGWSRLISLAWNFNQL